LFGLNLILKLLKPLQSKRKPRNIALGFALGSIIGLTPLWSLHNLLVLFLILVLDVSVFAALFSIIVFSSIAYLFDPFFHYVGYFLLVEVKWLEPFWTDLYNIPVLPWTKFYNTVVLGSLVVSLLAFYPGYLGFKQIVRIYQVKRGERANKRKSTEHMKGSKIAESITGSGLDCSKAGDGK